MEEWYSCIEEPLKELVYLLRNNGFNTECSCGHELYIQCQFILEGEIKRLHDLLFHNGYLNYEINIIIKVMEGHTYPSLDIRFKDRKAVYGDRNCKMF